MDKFQRNYSLSIQANEVLFEVGEDVIIKPPFTINFDVQRNQLTSANVISISIYNLSTDNQQKISKDQFDTDLFKSIKLSAGYGENLSDVFVANVTKASSTRSGNNIITTIEAFDGGFAYNNSKYNGPFKKGTSKRSLVKDIVKSLEKYGIAVGSIGEIKGSLERGNSYSGNTISILKELTDGRFFIDNGVAHVLGDNEFIETKAGISKIDSSAGFLGTPKKENTFLIFDIVFEPRLIVGQELEVESDIYKFNKGKHKVTSIKHRGMISGAISGKAVTTVGLFYGTKGLKGVTSE